jgi:Ca2+-binding RTX toxin-like protein
VTVSLALATAQVSTGDASGDILSGFENLTGSALADTLTGDANANTLDGGAGNDTLIGGLGNDIYVVDAVGDIVTEAAAGGTDLINASVTIASLAAEVENLTLTGAAAINGTGNALANVITGNAANNIIIGGAGADTLAGGAGTDTVSYLGSAAGVTVSLALATAQVSTGDASGDILSGFENLTGSALADTLTGDANANTLDGGAGNDTMAGGAGNDFLTGGTGSDIFRFDTVLNATTNIDSVNDFNVVDDTLQLENTIFAALTVIGNLSTSQFKNISLGAIDADDRVIYNGTTGALSYDADGSGAAVAIQFAQLTGNPVLTFSDFIVI